MTEWRTIPSFPAYEASDTGEVRRRVSQHTLAQNVNRNGYVYVNLWLQGRHKSASVHRLICEAFHGTPPSSRHDAAHWNGNKQYNHASNLRWLSRSENERDKVRVGRSNRGERCGTAKLSEADVVYLRQAWAKLPRASGGKRIKKGATRFLEEKFGVSRACIYHAVRGLHWRYVL